METKDFIRQKDNEGALLNVNNAALAEYKVRKKMSRTLWSHEDKIQNLEKELKEIKEQLTKLIKAE